VGDCILQNYDIKIYGKRKSKRFQRLEEIWAHIHDLRTGESSDICLWWKDTSGVIHDESSNIPVELRSIIDNAWIESYRK
jgi:hypothetical protein